MPYTAPYSQDAGGGPVWSGFCITMPWQIYLTYGDRRPLELGWPVMKKWLAFIDTKMGDGLLQSYVGIGCAGSPEWNFLGDWVPPGRKQGQDRVDDRSTLFFNNCYLVYCLQLAGKIGRVVGDDAQAEIYADAGEGTRRAAPCAFPESRRRHLRQRRADLSRHAAALRHHAAETSRRRSWPRWSATSRSPATAT